MDRMRLIPIVLILLLACNFGAPPGSADTSADQPEEGESIPPAQGDSPQNTPRPEEDEAAPDGGPSAVDVSPPSETVKLIFIHHSCGENWLADWSGGLGLTLTGNNYFVSDTNYGWGPEDPSLGGAIGDFTDIGHWWNWFLGPSSEEILRALFDESGQHSEYTRMESDPGGENEIVLFKSCFPNSALEGDPVDPPAEGASPLQGMDCGSDMHTVANAKRIYLDLLDYFAAHTDKLFIAVTAPPLLDTSPEQAANARAFNRWLVEEWLSEYSHANVAVFDFYNVLTSNGGNPNTNDLDSKYGNHHRIRNGQVDYVTGQGGDGSAYAEEGDSHPTPAGNLKATAEFVPLLNHYYHLWRG
ncbi:MAG: hypothetical protein JW929_06165 [Anaerolineales bacterium]|nr:hypothetical protein [Anaerolineales bacterium]